MPGTVLLLAHHFPPVGGAGVQRAMGLVRYLPALGWRTIVVTAAAGTRDFWSPLDAGLEASVGDVEVLRLPGSPPSPGRLRSLGVRWMVVPDGFRRWYREEAARLAPSLVGRADVVLAELGPYGCADAAVALARSLSVPLVMDLQDPWALDEMWLHPTGIQRALDRRRMERSLAAASCVVMNATEAADRVCRAFPRLRDRVTAIPNGFEASDFELPARRSDRSSFRIVHTGSMHTRMGLQLRRRRRLWTLLGGLPHPDLDVLPRSHVHLLAAVERLIEEEDGFATSAEVVLAGPLTDEDRAVIAETGAAVSALGFVSHAATIELIRDADVLFLPMHALEGGGRAGLVPAKTYEYLASGRPILAAVPPGDARDLLTSAGSAEVVDPGDVDGIAAALRLLYRRWRLGEATPPPPPGLLASLAYDTVAKRVAEVLDRTIARRGLS